MDDQNKTEEKTLSTAPSNFPFLLLGVLLLLGLYSTSLYNYLLFHSIAEGFSIIVACGVFMLAWNLRRLLSNDYLLFLGIAYLFIAILDSVHTLAYVGMGVFPEYDSNLPTQLWIATRYVESLSLLIAPFFLYRRLKPHWCFFAYTLVAALLLTAIFSERFPAAFVEGEGLTQFKVVGEYIISLILVGAAAMLYRSRSQFDRETFYLILTSIAVTVGSEMAFTLYTNLYGFANLIGHFLKIVSFYLIYRAIIRTGLVKPHNLLYRDLKQNEEQLREARNALELRVQERTVELTQANKPRVRVINEPIRHRTEEEQRPVGR